jgi:hypothetical protein
MKRLLASTLVLLAACGSAHAHTSTATSAPVALVIPSSRVAVDVITLSPPRSAPTPTPIASTSSRAPLVKRAAVVRKRAVAAPSFHLGAPCARVSVATIPDPNAYRMGMNGYHYDFVAAPQTITILRVTSALSDPRPETQAVLSSVAIAANTLLPSGGYVDVTTGRWWWVAVPAAGIETSCDGFMWVQTG